MTDLALVFDLDGTLVDTAPDLIGALNAVLLQEGRQTVAVDEVRYLVGHGAATMLDKAMRMTGEPVAPERIPGLMDAFVAHYRGHIAADSRMFPGVESTLAALADGGARLGVLTNKPEGLTNLLLPAVGLAKYFRAIHGAGRLEVVKPNARVYHHVVEEMGGDGAGSVMIGDSATDVATARAAGVPVIILTYGYSPEPVQTLGADAVLDDFRDVPATVGRLLKKP